jgi:signal transduction histidine kinase
MASSARGTATTAGAVSGAPARGTAPVAALQALVRAPFAPRALRELLFCLIGVAVGLGVVWALFGVPLTAALIGRALFGGSPRTGGSQLPARGDGALTLLAGAQIVALSLIVLVPRIARGVGSVLRRLAGALLGDAIRAPAPVKRRGRGPLGWLAGGLRDGAGWRSAAYLLLKVPLSVFDGYAVFCWIAGLANLTYPFWWRLFRNHPPGVRLDPVAVLTPVGSFRVATYPGTFAAFAAGAAMLLAAPWIARGVNGADRALMRALLGPGRLAQRVRDLEETRARAVDDSAALLRRLERNLHDGAQMRLAALAMNLGRAKESLGDDGDAADLASARDLVDAAHRSAKDALVELRDLARGIHPPVLDNGLADALATLAAGSAIRCESVWACGTGRRRRSRRWRTSAPPSCSPTPPSTATPT